MACKEEPRGAKPFLSGLVKIQLLYQGAFTPVAHAANVLHAKWLSGNNHSVADLTSLASNIQTYWNTGLMDSVHSTWSLVGTVVSSLGGDGLSVTDGTIHQGSQGGNPLPPQSAVCISWKTGITARGGRARTYLPGIPTTATVAPGAPGLANTYTNGVKTGAIAFINNIDAATIGGDSAIIGVPSYYHQCQLRPIPVFYQTITAVVHDRLDSQRRRSGKESTFAVT